MSASAENAVVLWPLAVYSVVIVLLIISMLLLSYFLGQRHSDRLTGRPYESGIDPTGSARLRFDIKYYMVAMFFVIFDLEAVFIYAWSVSLYETGWAGYVEILIFIFILMASLVYLWKIGALEWGTPRRKPYRMR